MPTCGKWAEFWAEQGKSVVNHVWHMCGSMLHSSSAESVIVHFHQEKVLKMETDKVTALVPWLRFLAFVRFGFPLACDSCRPVPIVEGPNEFGGPASRPPCSPDKDGPGQIILGRPGSAARQAFHGWLSGRSMSGAYLMIWRGHTRPLHIPKQVVVGFVFASNT